MYMSELVEAGKIQLKSGNSIQFFRDDDPINPREDGDELVTFHMDHNRYNFPQELEFKLDNDRIYSIDDVVNQVQDHYGPVLHCVIYMYEHSGYTFRTTPFGDRFDSGVVGIAFVPLSRIRTYFNVTRVSQKLRQKVYQYIVDTVKEYDLYSNGEVYGYMMKDPHGDDLDSCWGFLGDTTEYTGIFEHLDNETKNELLEALAVK